MKRKAPSSKCSKKDLAFDHWKQQIDLAANECSKWCAKHLELNEELHQTQLQHECEILYIRAKQSANVKALTDAQQRLKSAKARCKDPIFKHLTKIFPLTILELLSEYNAAVVCPACNGYFPRALSSCCNSKGHRLEVVVSELKIENQVCTWKPAVVQEIWDDALSMVTNKSKIARQKIITQYYMHNGEVLVLSMQPHSLTVTPKFDQRLICYKLSNTFDAREKQ